MPDPPVPVLMLYDPEEFWKQVREIVREEMAASQAQAIVIQSAIEKAGLPVKPAYTLAEIKALFLVSDETLEEWTSAGLLRPTRVGQQTYILYTDLVNLFNTK